jgi:CubicO group peptidase (beta-lactamase class C family)
MDTALILRIGLGLASAVLAAACAPQAARQAYIDSGNLAPMFSDYMEIENIPGVSLVVMKGDEVIRRQGFSVASLKGGETMPTDRPQPIYSVSKQFTAVLNLRLAEQSLVDLDAPVSR